MAKLDLDARHLCRLIEGTKDLSVPGPELGSCCWSLFGAEVATEVCTDADWGGSRRREPEGTALKICGTSQPPPPALPRLAAARLQRRVEHQEPCAVAGPPTPDPPEGEQRRKGAKYEHQRRSPLSIRSRRGANDGCGPLRGRAVGERSEGPFRNITRRGAGAS